MITTTKEKYINQKTSHRKVIFVQLKTLSITLKKKNPVEITLKTI